MGSIDLRMMKKAENTVVGFEVTEGFINTEKGQLSRSKEAIHLAVPTLEVTFMVANGERRKPFNVTLASVLPLVSALTTWAMEHSSATVQDVLDDRVIGGNRPVAPAGMTGAVDLAGPESGDEG